jgi:hypothetical protein
MDRQFYKTIEDRDQSGMCKAKIFQLLRKCWYYDEYDVREISGGRDGDMSKETVEYNLFRGGYAVGIPSGLQVGVCQVTIDSTNGWCQYLSVILRGEPSERDIREKREAFQKLLQQLEEMEFTPKYTYLRDPKVILQHSFKKWLDELIQPQDVFRRESL